MLNIYKRLPAFLQTIAINYKGLLIKLTRYNKNFKKHFDIYCNNIPTKPSVDFNELFNFIKIANTSEYWFIKFREYNIDLSSNDLTQQILKLPILTKEEVNLNYSKFKTKTNLKVTKVITSGTTGTKFIIPQTRLMENKQWAIWWRFRSMHGIKLNDWCGWMGGQNVVPKKQNSSSFWRTNYFGRQIMFSPLHFNLENTIHYYNKINNNKLTWLHGYPSQIALFASNVIELGLPPLKYLKIISTGAEGLMDYQREIINKAFQVPIIQHYGMAEGVANISIWPDNKWRVDSDFCLVEFIPIDPLNPTICKIIGTNYSNYAFPLIRYDTGDIATVNWDNGIPDVLAIEGRIGDYITLKNGNRFGPMNLIFKKFSNVKEAQLYYPKPNLLVFKIVQDNNYLESRDEKIIRSSIQERLTDNEADVVIDYVTNVKRTESGKVRSVIYHL